MPDESVILNPGAGGAAIAVDEIAGVSHELVKVEFGQDGTATQVSAADPLPVTDNAAELSLASIDLKTSDGSQKTQVVDGSGNVVGSTGNAMDVNIKSGNVTLVAQDIEIGAVELKNGTDDTRATITPANALKVDGSAVTQPVSAAALPLPAGAATSALQTQPGVDIGDVTINNAAGASAVNIQDGGNSITVDGTVSAVVAGTVAVSNFPATQPVSGTVTANAGTNLNTSLLALESGGNLAAIKTDVDKIPSQGQALAAASMPVVLPATQITTLTPPAAITNYALETGGNLASIKTDVDKIPSQGQAAMVASMPVVIASNQTAVPISAASLPLPAGAATAALQTQPGVDIGDVTINNATGASAVNIQDGGNSITVDGTIAVSNFPATQPVSGTVTANAGTNLNTSLLALESGGNLASIKTDVDKIPSQGQAAMASSMPVVIASNQSAVPVSGTFFQATQPVSAASLPLPTGAATAALQTQPGVDIGDVTINNATGAGAVNIQDGGNSITVDGTVAIGAGSAVIGHVITDSGSTTAVSGNVTAVQATGTNLHTVVDSGTVTANAGTNLNTSLLALESGGNLASIKTDVDKIPSQGQAAMASSMPVVIASNQSAIPVSFSGSPATDNTQLYSSNLSAAGAITGIDTTGYASIITQLTGTAWSGSIIIEGSNDNSNWTELLVMDVNELSMTDVIAGNGIYAFKTTSKYIRLNVLQVTGTITALILGRTSAGISGADLLSFAMDRNNNLPLYTQDITGSPKKDANLAAVPSDAPFVVSGFLSSVTNAFTPTIDTSGYQSISVQLPSATGLGNVDFQESNDGATWVLVPMRIVNRVGGVIVVNDVNNVNLAGIYTAPTVGRYFRILCSAGIGGLIQYSAYLRQAPISTAVINQNLAFINGTATSSSGFSGALAIGGSVTNGGATSTFPVTVGGVDLTTTPGSALSRRLVTDPNGRLITSVTDQSGTGRALGGLSPGSNPYNIASLATQDVAQVDGQSQIEIMAQILLETRIMNQYLFDLPAVLQTVFATLNNSNNTLLHGFKNEPQEFRNEQSIFNN